MVALCGAFTFGAIKPGSIPVPEEGKPMPGLLFDHVKFVPTTLLVNTVPGNCPPEQIVISACGFTTGMGFTVIVKDSKEFPQEKN